MTDQAKAMELLPCPFCKGAVQFRKALWPSDGNVDAIIHAASADCGMIEFTDGTIDESILAKWNIRAVQPSDGVRKTTREEVIWIVMHAYGFEKEKITNTAWLHGTHSYAIATRVADAILALSTSPVSAGRGDALNQSTKQGVEGK